MSGQEVLRSLHREEDNARNLERPPQESGARTAWAGPVHKLGKMRTPGKAVYPAIQGLLLSKSPQHPDSRLTGNRFDSEFLRPYSHFWASSCTNFTSPGSSPISISTLGPHSGSTPKGWF